MGDRETLQDLRSQFKDLQETRRKYEPTWDEITEILLPNLSLYDENGNSKEGEKYGQNINDGIGPISLNTMKNGFLGNMVSRALVWMRLGREDERQPQSGRLRHFFQETEKALYNELANSNFYEVLSRLFKSGAGIGVSYFSVEENYEEGITVVHAHHFRTMWIVIDSYGNLIVAFRKFSLSLREIKKKWKDGFPTEFEQPFKDNPNQKKDVFHVVIPNEDYNPEKQARDKKRYASYYYIEGRNEFLSKGGFDEMPYGAWLWEQEEGETYGRGKGHEALVLLRRNNLIASTLDQAAELSIKPPVQYHRDVEDIIDLTPDGMNPYENPENIIIPVELGKNYPYGKDREEMYNQIIREIFHVDFFHALENKSKQMTAREVDALQGEQATIMGTEVDSIQNGLLEKLIEKIYFNAYENGRMPEIPEELLQSPNQKIDIDYIGPLTQALKRYHQTKGIALGLEDIGFVAKFDEKILDNYNFDVISRTLSESDGMPADTMRDKKDVQKLRNTRAQAQQMVLQQQQMQQGVEMADKLNQPQVEGSLLEELEKQLTGAIPGNQQVVV